MKLIFLATMFAVMLSGCAVLDSLTGVGDPEVEAGTKASAVERISEGAEDALPWPWSLIAGAVLGGGAVTYRTYRKEQAARDGSTA